MKGREGLSSSVRRLRRLLSISGTGRVGVSSFGSHLPRQVCSESASRRDDFPLDLPSFLGEGLSDSKATCRASPSYFTALWPSNSCSDSSSYPTKLRCLLPAESLLHSPPLSLSVSAHLFHSSFRVSTAHFATSRERVQEDEEDEEVGEPWRQGRRETLLRNTAEKPKVIEDTVPVSEVRIGNEKALKVGREDASGGLRVEFRQEVGWSELGWTREEVLNWPNAISTARLLSGPLLAWMIVHELWSPALVGLVIAAVTDWLDGYVARKMDVHSVLGSYLDPVADKFLVGSVAVSMAYTGLLNPALVGVIVARDGTLMGGAFVYRAYSLGWQWNDWREFWRISIGGAGKVEPLIISKVNTVFQLSLVGLALLQHALSIEDTYSLIPLLSWSVVVTTSMSWVAYVYIYVKNPGSLAAKRRVAHAPGPRASSGSASAPRNKRTCLCSSKGFSKCPETDLS